MPRNTQTAVEFADEGKRYVIDDVRSQDAIIRLQSGTNKFESQKVSFLNLKGECLSRVYLEKNFWNFCENHSPRGKIMRKFDCDYSRGEKINL